MHHCGGVREDKQPICMRIDCYSKRVLQFTYAAEGNIDRHDTQSLAGFLSGAPFRLFSGVIGIRQYREGAQFWRDVLQQLNPFPRQLKRKERGAREITARLPEALDDAQLYRIAT